MSCKKVNGLINSLIEGNISAAEEAEIKAHVKTCQKCGAEYKAALALKNVFSDMKEEPKLPADFNLKVWDRIGAASSPSLADRILGYIRKPVFIAPAGVLVAAVIFGLFVMNPGVVQDKKAELASAEPAVKTAEKQEITKIKKAVTYIAQKQSEDEKQIVSAEPVKEDIIKEESKDILKVNQFAAVNSAADEKIPQPLKGNNEKASAAPVIAAADKSIVVTPTPAEIEVKNNVINGVKGERLVIKYRLDNEGQVEIRIYDRTGRPVVHFYEKKPAGVYEFIWEGKDDSGSLLASGIYTVYIKTPLVEKKIKSAVIR
ncbi:MAG TPA: FlgD immunoglobulin-like domain containing protein [Candidatus Goldiibacteriota bacterium]|nr:FlgD immunoglobulin-like domain containing protein [Candidatus Goldiibacteriota bacterium]HRQ42811.1 FlgD immunoglobulin-like domain containing protein [Candidatus Goldiibacteriota bacterium]